MSAEASRNPHLPVRPDWLALRREPALEPELPIIDAHHHFYDRPEWRYDVDDLVTDLDSGHNVVATVYMQARAHYRRDGPDELRPVGETEFVSAVAARSAAGAFGARRLCAGIVGYADLRLGPHVRGVLEAHIVTGRGRFRGVRQIAAWHADPQAHGSSSTAPPHLFTDPAFRAGFAELAPLGLSFVGWLYHTQLGELVDLAGAFPATQIILNHIGGPIGIGPYERRRDEVFAEWQAAMRELAACENVSVKIGGLGMRMFGFNVHTGALPPSSEELATAWRPYIEATIAAFGPQRSMFESNFPVDKGTCSYGVLWNTFKRITAGYSPTEKTALFSGTARRVYRLEA